ncbi:hypothetical protein [Ferruginibacter albus]|uniref:hypothetical protein n=1 Tax=Ferruginibacter albus TaxID=2875540 RepID=UPI001CC785B0|nr:hypothetical protein [Ferruginibacter albus]UAY52740.1 hypothetical protein K9M53_03370 [Ferruginibacter albus]
MAKTKNSTVIFKTPIKNKTKTKKGKIDKNVSVRVKFILELSVPENLIIAILKINKSVQIADKGVIAKKTLYTVGNEKESLERLSQFKIVEQYKNENYRLTKLGRTLNV